MSPENEACNGYHRPWRCAINETLCSVSGTGSTYLALYEMAHEHVMATAAWSQAANTEWTNNLRPHFKASIHLGKRIF